MQIGKIQPPKSLCFPAGTCASFSIWAFQAGMWLVFPEPQLLKFSKYRRNVSLSFTAPSEGRGKGWRHEELTKSCWAWFRLESLGLILPLMELSSVSPFPFTLESHTLVLRVGRERLVYRLIYRLMLPSVAITCLAEWKQSLALQLPSSLCGGLGRRFLLPFPWERAGGAGGGCSPCPGGLSHCSLHTPPHWVCSSHQGLSSPGQQSPLPRCSAWTAVCHHCHLGVCRKYRALLAASSDTSLRFKWWKLSLARGGWVGLHVPGFSGMLQQQ